MLLAFFFFFYSPCFVKIAIFRHDKCRICLPGKSGIYRVYEAKIPVFPAISTKICSCRIPLIWLELIFWLNTSNFLGTFWFIIAPQ